MTMKALVIHELVTSVDQLKISDWPIPECDNDSVRIKVESVSANFFDILQVQGKYQFKPPLPFIPGAEFAGVIDAVGADVKDFQKGDKVFGGSFVGAYAEYITVSPGNVYHIPKGLSFDEASGIFGTYPTSYGALKVRANMKPGETVLVHAGAGGVGLAAVQCAKALGAKTVIATCGSDDKCEIAKKYGGADHAINYSKNKTWWETVKQLTDGNGVDIVYDPVGLVEESTKCINWNGRVLVIGFAGGSIPKFPVNRALLKNCSIVGFMWGGYQANEREVIPGVFRDLMTLFEQGKLKPIVYQPVTVGLENIPKALHELGSRSTYGKVVVRPVHSNKSKL